MSEMLSAWSSNYVESLPLTYSTVEMKQPSTWHTVSIDWKGNDYYDKYLNEYFYIVDAQNLIFFLT